VLQLQGVLASCSQEDEAPQLCLRPGRQLRHHRRQPAEVQKMPFPALPAGRNDGERHTDGGAEEAPVPEDAPEARGHDEPPEWGNEGGEQVTTEPGEHLLSADAT